METSIKIKLEPQTILPHDTPSDDCEVKRDGQVFSPLNTVFIKSEPLDLDNSTELKTENTVENIEVKIEPIHYDSGGEQALDLSLATSSNGPVIKTLIKKERHKNEKRKKDGDDTADEDYIPSKKYRKKKTNSEANVKPIFKGKSNQPQENLYPDSVLEHIEIVTINEAERQLEHRSIWQSRMHMRYTCEDCAIGFVVEDAYLMHMKIHTPEAGQFECDLCHTWMRSGDVLYRHRLRHFRRYRCRLCRGVFRDKETAACHVHAEHARRAFLCPHCGKGFKRPQYLKRHVEQMHTKLNVFECPVCQQVVHERSRYRSHIRTHNDEVRTQTHRPVLICDTCSRQFRSKANLKRHLVTHEQGFVVCQVCSYPCKNLNVLRVHYRRNHKDAGPETLVSERQCVHCMRICASQALLRHHVRRMHTDRTKKYQCDHCKRFYLTKGEVRAHIAWSHLRAAGAGGGHECPCGRVFRTPAQLRAHHARDHLQLQLPRDYACGECGKAFTSNQILKRHMKSHSDKTYPCLECGHTFKTESYVTVHHKLKHLHMTRAQIRAERKPKLVHMTAAAAAAAAHPANTNTNNKKKKKNKRRKQGGARDPGSEGNEIVQIKIEPESDGEAAELLDTLADVKAE